MASDTLRRRVYRLLLEGGLVLTAVGAIYHAYRDTVEDKARQHAAICARADAAILDDALNSALTPGQKQQFLSNKLQISSRCDKVSPQ